MRALIKQLALLLVMSILLSGCTSDGTSQDIERNSSIKDSKRGIKLGSYKESNTIGLLKMVDKYRVVENRIGSTFKIYDRAEDVKEDFLKDDLDIAAIPLDLAVEVCEEMDGAVKIAAINSLGQYSILASGRKARTIEDLDGGTIYSIDEGSFKDSVLKSFINKAGLNLKIDYLSNLDELLELFKTGEDINIFLEEPFASIAEKDYRGRVISNLNSDWTELHNGDLLVTGVLIVRKEFARSRREDLEKFLEIYENSIKYTITNLEDMSRLVMDNGIISEDLGLKSIPRCNIVYIDGEDIEKYIKLCLLNLDILDRNEISNISDLKFIY